jgi:hypothetical protein
MSFSFAPINIEITDALMKARDRIGLAVLLCIANRCSQTGITDVGVKRIADTAGFTVARVREKLGEFEKLGWIKVRPAHEDREMRVVRYRIQLSPDIIYIRPTLQLEVLELWNRPAKAVFCQQILTKDQQPDSGLDPWIKPESKPETNQLQSSVPTKELREKTGSSAPRKSRSDDSTNWIVDYDDDYNQSASQIETPAAQLDSSAQQPPPVPARPPHIEALVFEIKRAAPTLSEKLIHELIERHGAGIVQSAYDTMIGTKNVRNPAAYLRSLITKKSGSNTAFNPLNRGSYLTREAITGKVS